MMEVQWVGALARVESLPDEISLRIFEGAGYLGLRTEPKKKRTRVGGQPRGEMAVQRGEIERAFAYERRHAGAASGSWNRDSVDAGMQDAVECAELLRQLGGRDVLALPAKGVADAVDEIEEALLVPAHQVAGPYPGVARCEDMAQDSLLGLGRTGVALEPAAGARRIVLHLADRLTGLVDAAANTETVLVANRLAFVEVEGDQRRREAVPQIRGDVADGSGLALHVEQRDASLGGSVKLEDLRDAEALLKRLPHAGRQAVATSEPKAVRRLALRIRAVQQVAAQLADVLKRGALPADDVAPELARREPLAHDH